jgi:hypothetical protein
MREFGRIIDPKSYQKREHSFSREKDERWMLVSL